MEQTYEAVAILVYYRCDACHAGFMYAAGAPILDNARPVWPHKCDKCAAVMNMDRLYPEQRWKPVIPD